MARTTHDELERVLTIPAVATLAGWSVSRMRRFLLAKHADMDGGLLCNVGRGDRRPRWSITLRALRSVAPQWFVDPESTQRQIEWLAEQSDDVREQLDGLSRRVSAQHTRMLTIAKAVVPLAQRRAS